MTTPRRRRFGYAPELALAIVLIVSPFVLPSIGGTSDTLSRILIWGLFGLGFDLIFGFTGLLSFGQAAFYGSGGFISSYLLVSHAVPNVFLALAIGLVGAALIGLVIGALALRRSGIYFAMITVAFGEMFFFLENSALYPWTGGENGLPNVPKPSLGIPGFSFEFRDPWAMYGLLAVIFFVGFVIARRIVASPFGHVLTAIRDNPTRAMAVGHDIQRYKLTVFVIAAAYAGLAGGLEGTLQGYMSPEAFTFDTSGQLVMQTVIGGAGTLIGPLVGGALWLYLRNELQSALSLGAAWKLVLGVVFVVLIMFLRRGIVGGVSDLWQLLRPARIVPEVAPEAAAEVQVTTHRPPPNPDRIAIETRGLGKRYGGIVANEDVNFIVHEGEIRGLIGPNGAGKSTFFKMLTGEVPASSGKIMMFGEDTTGLDVTAVCQKGVAKSYQINQLFSKLTVRRNLMISALSRTRGPFRPDMLRNVEHMDELNADIEETLRLLNLTARADMPVSQLAYGEKRRLEIGLALGTDPKILLLDEPLAGMSPTERSDTVKLLKQLAIGRTLVVVEHDMDALFGMADRVTVLAQGKILTEGTPAEVQQSAAVQDAYLGGVHGMSYLEVDKINSYSGDSHILFDVSMRLEQKEVVALLGRNGAGKSTTLKAMMGAVETKAGSIGLEGRELRGARTRHDVANAGLQLVPEERRIFGSLNVEENIVLAGLTAKPAWPLERVYEMFPRLKERRGSRGTDLSGGEQQMLAIARALTRNPKILLLDEPFEGLAPIIVRDLLAVCERLAAEGQTIIIVEQNLAAALSIASRAYILNNGHVVFDGTSAELKAAPDILARYVGV